MATVFFPVCSHIVLWHIPARKRFALFEPEACALVFQLSHGVPRLINSLCDTALEYGFEEQRPSIDGALVSEILGESMSGPLLGLAEPPVHEMRENGAKFAAVLKSGRQPIEPQERAGAVDSEGLTGERPENLEDALKVLSKLLD